MVSGCRTGRASIHWRACFKRPALWAPGLSDGVWARVQNVNAGLTSDVGKWCKPLGATSAGYAWFGLPSMSTPSLYIAHAWCSCRHVSPSCFTPTSLSMGCAWGHGCLARAKHEQYKMRIAKWAQNNVVKSLDALWRMQWILTGCALWAGLVCLKALKRHDFGATWSLCVCRCQRMV